MVFTGKFVYIYIYIYYIYKYIYNIYIYIIYVYVCVRVCVCVLTIDGGVDISGLSSFASIRHRNTIIFDTRKSLYRKEPPAKVLKTYLKGNGNICFVVI